MAQKGPGPIVALLRFEPVKFVIRAIAGICLALTSCSSPDSCRQADPSCSLPGLFPFITMLSQDWLVTVGTAGTVYYSSDRGRTWTAGNTGSALDLSGVVYTGNGRFVATGTSDRMIYSDDGGRSWRAAQTPSTGSVNHQALAFGNNTLLSATGIANIFVSTDKGVNWVSTTNPIAAVKNNADFVCGRFIFASNAQVAYSVDAISSTLSGSMPNFPTGKAACKNSRIIMATGAAPFAYYSDDFGVNWTAGGAGMGTIRRAIRLLGTQLFAFGDDTNVHVSSDGTSWSAGTAAPAGNIKDAVALDTLRMVVVGGSGAATLFYTENGGSSWTQVTGLPAVNLTSVALGRMPYF